eukprot:219196_1
MEWVSNYKEERERLFCCAYNMRISDIQYSIRSEVQYNNLYLAAFTLWSAIFAGYYFIFATNNRKQTEKQLLYLILNYKEHNGIRSEVRTWVDIPFYIQQLFYHLVNALAEEKRISINITEYLLLKESLQKELLQIQSQELIASPFLRSLGIKASDIERTQQYVWVLSEHDLHKLKYLQKDQFVMCDQSYDYEISETNMVKFCLGIRDRSFGDYTSFTLKIKDISSSSVRGFFSLAVDELKWAINGYALNNLSHGQSKNISFFDKKLLDNLNSLTLRISIIFY